MNIGARTLAGRPEVWAVGGGKGGTGKSLVAASLGIHLAQMGRRVILVDGDLGAPNLHTILGLDPPPLALSDFIKRRFESIETVVFETGVERLSLISGARNSLDIESLKHFQKTRLLRVLLGLPADIVLLDLGAGTSLNVLDLFSLADREKGMPLLSTPVVSEMPSPVARIGLPSTAGASLLRAKPFLRSAH